MSAGEGRHFSAKASFQEIRDEYARLLETHQIHSYRDAREALERPLCLLWMAAYKRTCKHETYLELLDDRGSTFLHDSSESIGVGPVNRVVAALTVSLEILPLEALLKRLQAERSSGRSFEETRFLVHLAFTSLIEGLSARNLEALTQAAAHIVGLDLQPIPALVDWLIPVIQSASSLRRARRILRRVLDVLNSGVAQIGEMPARLRMRPEERIGSLDLEVLRAMAARAEEGLPPEMRIAVARELAGLVPGVLSELEKRIAEDPGEHLREQIRRHILTLDFVNTPRLRYLKGARHRRVPGGKMDFGHFIAHSTGGPADINLFYQDRHLNRGWSEQGRAYRFMERYAAGHPGTFYFSRAIYDDATEILRYLELGVLLTREQARELGSVVGDYEGFNFCFPGSHPSGIELTWWVGVFDNRPADR
jgi:hypothetical protein